MVHKNLLTHKNLLSVPAMPISSLLTRTIKPLDALRTGSKAKVQDLQLHADGMCALWKGSKTCTVEGIPVVLKDEEGAVVFRPYCIHKGADLGADLGAPAPRLGESETAAYKAALAHLRYLLSLEYVTTARPDIKAQLEEAIRQAELMLERLAPGPALLVGESRAGKTTTLNQMLHVLQHGEGGGGECTTKIYVLDGVDASGEGSDDGAGSDGAAAASSASSVSASAETARQRARACHAAREMDDATQEVHDNLRDVRTDREYMETMKLMNDHTRDTAAKVEMVDPEAAQRLSQVGPLVSLAGSELRCSTCAPQLVRDSRRPNFWRVIVNLVSTREVYAARDAVVAQYGGGGSSGGGGSAGGDREDDDQTEDFKISLQRGQDMYGITGDDDDDDDEHDDEDDDGEDGDAAKIKWNRAGGWRLPRLYQKLKGKRIVYEVQAPSYEQGAKAVHDFLAQATVDCASRAVQPICPLIDHVEIEAPSAVTPFVDFPGIERSGKVRDLSFSRWVRRYKNAHSLVVFASARHHMEGDVATRLRGDPTLDLEHRFLRYMSEARDKPSDDEAKAGDEEDPFAFPGSGGGGGGARAATAAAASPSSSSGAMAASAAADKPPLPRAHNDQPLRLIVARSIEATPGVVFMGDKALHKEANKHLKKLQKNTRQAIEEMFEDRTVEQDAQQYQRDEARHVAELAKRATKEKWVESYMLKPFRDPSGGLLELAQSLARHAGCDEEAQCVSTLRKVIEASSAVASFYRDLARQQTMDSADRHTLVKASGVFEAKRGKLIHDIFELMKDDVIGKVKDQVSRLQHQPRTQSFWRSALREQRLDDVTPTQLSSMHKKKVALKREGVGSSPFGPADRLLDLLLWPQNKQVMRIAGTLRHENIRADINEKIEDIVERAIDDAEIFPRAAIAASETETDDDGSGGGSAVAASSSGVGSGGSASGGHMSDLLQMCKDALCCELRTKLQEGVAARLDILNGHNLQVAMKLTMHDDEFLDMAKRCREKHQTHKGAPKRSLEERMEHFKKNCSAARLNVAQKMSEFAETFMRDYLKGPPGPGSEWRRDDASGDVMSGFVADVVQEACNNFGCAGLQQKEHGVFAATRGRVAQSFKTFSDALRGAAGGAWHAQLEKDIEAREGGTRLSAKGVARKRARRCTRTKEAPRAGTLPAMELDDLRKLMTDAKCAGGNDWDAFLEPPHTRALLLEACEKHGVPTKAKVMRKQNLTLAKALSTKLWLKMNSVCTKGTPRKRERDEPSYDRIPAAGSSSDVAPPKRQRINSDKR